MITTNHEGLKKIIKRVYEKRMPLYVWGTAGIGKSQNVKETARELSVDYIDIRLSQLEPSDLRGIPVTTDKVTKWLPPSWLPSDKESKGILFLDEINLSPPSIQAAAYQLILDRQLGDYFLPDGWMVISAGNRIEDKANVFDIPFPLANRFLHVELRVPSAEEWTTWALQSGIDDRIVSFLNFKPNRVHSFDAKNKDKAVATPRTWQYCSTMIAGITDYDELYTMSSLAVGEGVATELNAFLKIGRKIDVKKILENPESVKDLETIDLKYAVLSTFTEYYKKNKSSETLKAVVRVCAFMDAEFCVLLLRMIKVTDQKFFTKEAPKIKEFVELAREKAKYLLD